MLNKLLQRQIQKYFGDAGKIPQKYSGFLQVISESYDHYEKDRKMLERSIDLSSEEMIELNTKLRKETDELKKTHTELNRIFNSVNEGFYSLDMTNARYINMSAACEKIFGYTVEEFYENKNLWYDIIHPDDKEMVDRNDKKVHCGEQVFQQFRIIHKDQSIRWLESKLIPTLDQSGKLIRIDCVVNDTTDKKDAEEEVIRRKSFYRALLEKSTDMKSLVSAEGIILYGSPSITGILGFAREEYLGKSGFELIHPDDVPKLKELTQELMNEPGESFYHQSRIRHKDGTYRWCEGTLTNLLHDTNIKALVSNFRDITEKKMAEEVLQKSEANLRTVFENTEISYILLDAHLKIVMFNQLANESFIQEMLGPLVAGNCLVDHLPKDLQAGARERYNRVLNGEPINYEIKYPLYNNTEGWFDVKLSPVRNPQNSILGIIIAISNITNRKSAEAEREKMTSDLVQRNKDLEQFAYIVSHNLRGPMSNILGLSHLLMDEQIPERKKKLVLPGLTSSVEKLDDVIRDLNFILQIREGVNEKKMNVCVPDLIRDIVSTNVALMEKENIELKTDLEKVNRVFTLRSYLHSIFYNLISNSIKYRQPGIKLLIEISGKRIHDKIELAYKDNGIGINLEKKKDHVFGLYKRFHPEIAEGKGMGLYMVKTQVEAIGGKISVDSAVNKGTEFRIELVA